MKKIETEIKDLVIIEPKIFEDSRGFFITIIKKLGEENETNIWS